MKLLDPASRLVRRSARVFSLLILAQCLAAHAESRHVEKQVVPVYPELARRMHIGGTVRVTATVSADGSVTDAKAQSGNALLTTAAEQAVLKWKFEQAAATSSEVVKVNFVISN